MNWLPSRPPMVDCWSSRSAVCMPGFLRFMQPTPSPTNTRTHHNTQRARPLPLLPCSSQPVEQHRADRTPALRRTLPLGPQGRTGPPRTDGPALRPGLRRRLQLLAAGGDVGDSRRPPQRHSHSPRALLPADPGFRLAAPRTGWRGVFVLLVVAVSSSCVVAINP